jgi:hypothetical protein
MIARGFRPPWRYTRQLWSLWDQIESPTLLLRGADSDLLLQSTAEEMIDRRLSHARLSWIGAVDPADWSPDAGNVILTVDASNGWGVVQSATRRTCWSLSSGGRWPQSGTTSSSALSLRSHGFLDSQRKLLRASTVALRVSSYVALTVDDVPPIQIGAERRSDQADGRYVRTGVSRENCRRVVRKYVKLIYDPAIDELVEVVMPFETKSEVTYLKIDKGWVTEASVEDVKLLPGVRRTMFRLLGGEWVAREVVKDVQGGRAKFILNTGDMVWWGKQGGTPSENPYWKLVYEGVLRQLPAPDQQMRDAGLPGRVFPAVGNHEVWDDSDVEGLLHAFPYLKQFGVSDKRFIYKFDFNGVRFIFLWTGKYDYRSPSSWDATRPAYDAQMTELKTWLDEAKAAGIKKTFISFHAPAFARSGMGAGPEAENPHKIIASYAKDLDIVVFNGHVHTTEL